MAGDIYNNINILQGAATVWVDGANIGWTRDGATLEHASENYFVEVDQELSPVKGKKIKETFRVKVNIVELTLENLKIAWAIPNSIDDTTYAGFRHLGFGGDPGTLPEHVVELRSPAPGDSVEDTRQRIIHFWKAISVEFGEMIFNKTGESMVPVTFEVLIDPDQAANEKLGYFRDQAPQTWSDLVCRVTVTSA